MFGYTPLPPREPGCAAVQQNNALIVVMTMRL